MSMIGGPNYQYQYEVKLTIYNTIIFSFYREGSCLFKLYLFPSCRERLQYWIG